MDSSWKLDDFPKLNIHNLRTLNNIKYLRAHKLKYLILGTRDLTSSNIKYQGQESYPVQILNI